MSHEWNQNWTAAGKGVLSCRDGNGGSWLYHSHLIEKEIHESMLLSHSRSGNFPSDVRCKTKSLEVWERVAFGIGSLLTGQR